MCLLNFLLYTMYLYFCRIMSLMYNFCHHLYFGNVDLLMDLLYVSKADSTFKAYYAGFMRCKKLLRMALTCWIYSQEIRFMLHLFIFFNTNKSYRQSRYYSLHWAHTVWENISD